MALKALMIYYFSFSLKSSSQIPRYLNPHPTKLIGIDALLSPTLNPLSRDAGTVHQVGFVGKVNSVRYNMDPTIETPRSISGSNQIIIRNFL